MLGPGLCRCWTDPAVDGRIPSDAMTVSCARWPIANSHCHGRSIRYCYVYVTSSHSAAIQVGNRHAHAQAPSHASRPMKRAPDRKKEMKRGTWRCLPTTNRDFEARIHIVGLGRPAGAMMMLATAKAWGVDSLCELLLALRVA
ncbi:hypothetical protein LZ32DRAFT_218148 [Colletotrichum eremochloae]|nr:hypothetical protein LZ32DRAFT_218148 [Colletotrichum eremochloae]